MKSPSWCVESTTTKHSARLNHEPAGGGVVSLSHLVVTPILTVWWGAKKIFARSKEVWELSGLTVGPVGTVRPVMDLSFRGWEVCVSAVLAARPPTGPPDITGRDVPRA